jgi:tetratricopeptide (TPR) repeat protein
MKKQILAAFAIATTLQANAQDNNQCAVNYSMYKEFLNVEAYNEAHDAYWEVLNNCPKFSKNVYVDGIKMYKALIASSNNTATINAYVDTLKQIYQQRIDNYGENASILGRCGLDIMRYRKSDTSFMEAYHMLGQAIALTSNDPELTVMSAYVQLSMSLTSQGKISTEQLFKDIVPNIVTIYTNRSIKDESYTAQTEKIIDNIKNNLPKVKGYVAVFDSLFPATYSISSDLEEVSTLSNTMNVVSATSNILYAQAAERLYADMPTASAAASIARYNRNIKEYTKAAKFYAEAANMESDTRLKSEYLYEAATVANNLKKYAEAVELAKKAINANPNNAAPLLLISAIYMVNANTFSTDHFEQGKIYWVAADYAQRALKADNKIAEQANTLINQCRPLYPSKEDAFMHSIKQGDIVKVSVYGSETTIARF